MISTTLPKNNVITQMSYHNEMLVIMFKKGQERSYSGVPAPVAYGLYYTKTGSECLAYYSNNIKGKYTVTVK